MQEAVKKAIESGLNKIPTLDITDEGLGPWSVSTLKTLQKCPLKFFLDKIAKAKPEIIIDESSIVTQVGRAAHFWVENIVLGLPIEEAYELTRTEHLKDVTEAFWPMVESLRGSMFAFSERFERFKQSNEIAKIQPELKIGLTKDFLRTGFFAKDVFFRGVIDLPILLTNGDVIIIDHKYGPDPEWGTKHYQKQFDSYKVLYHRGVRKIRGVQTGIHFMKHVDMVMDKYTPVETIEGKLIHSLSMDIKDAVRRVADDGTFNYSRTTLCNYCDFRDSCKGGKRGTAGELQYIVEESRPLVAKALEKSQ